VSAAVSPPAELIPPFAVHFLFYESMLFSYPCQEATADEEEDL
jgi:hypothetical protein